VPKCDRGSSVANGSLPNYRPIERPQSGNYKSIHLKSGHKVFGNGNKSKWAWPTLAVGSKVAFIPWRRGKDKDLGVSRRLVRSMDVF
jgi:hypothetical protein